MEIPLNEYIVNTIGVSLSCALWGAATMQMFLYFLNYESDHFILKTAVGALWMLDTIIEILSFVGIFPPRGSPVSFTTGTVPWALIIRTMLTNVVAFCVQLFFLHRIYRLSGQRWAVRACLAVVALVALWQVVGAFMYTLWCLVKSLLVASTPHTPRTVAMAVSCRAVSAFVDVFIAAYMAFILRTKKHNLFRRTDKLIFRLTVLTINTGLWTAVLAIIDFSLIAWRPLNDIFVIFEYPLSALYLNTFLANLNARKYVRTGARADNLWLLSLGPIDRVSVRPTHVSFGSQSARPQGGGGAVLATDAPGTSGKNDVLDSALSARDYKA